MVIKAIGITFLCVLSVVVLLGIVLPSMPFGLGLGIQIPGDWMRYQKLLTLYAHPWISVLAGGRQTKSQNNW